MEQYPPNLQEAVRFHGHVCAGLIIGYRVAQLAQTELGTSRSEDEELVAIVENDACGVDAIQVILGCTLGKGNLIYRDHGKQVYTIIARASGRCMRIALKPDVLGRPPELESIFQKSRQDQATAEELKSLDAFRKNRMKELLQMDDSHLFKVEEVRINVPEKARIFSSVLCHYCNEKVMEPRARIRNGELACIPCAEEYTRGW